MLYALLLLPVIGHAVFWVACVNRLHALAINRKLMDALTALCGFALVALPPAIALLVWQTWNEPHYPFRMPWLAVWTYAAICTLACVVASFQWLQRLWLGERRGLVLSNHTSHIRAQDRATAPLTAPGIPTWLSRVPGNQVLDIYVHEKQLALPRLAPEHAGLRVIHLTDLHMSGRITRAYFEQVVDEVNRAEPDVVAITGDIVERNPCIDWIPATLGRLRASGGVFYILGNHDARVNIERLHKELKKAGLVHLGGRWQQITVRGAPLILAGNELPWFAPAADLQSCPARDEYGCPLRLLLAHTPDQLAWARSNDIDLMLAGHNHGGQIRLPLIGPIFAPSLHGVRYAAGVFRAGNTVLHVSRGTSSLTPIRLNCPPEIALLVLKQGIEVVS